MTPFTIQTLFLLYSALSFLSALLIGFLFWGRNDVSARLWLIGCLMTSIATLVTSFRSEIPVLISFSVMVFIESFSIFLFGESLKRLSKNSSTTKLSFLSFGIPLLLLIVVEFERYNTGNQITPAMSATASFFFGIGNLFCLYQARSTSNEFENRVFFNFLGIFFGLMTVLYWARVLNFVLGYGGYTFDLNTFNIFAWFFLIALGSIRNLAYIVLRLYLGFAEHSRLNNMNLKLSNLLDERNELILSLQKLNKVSSINALASTVAHEINQPLGAAKLNSQFAERKLDSEPIDNSLLKQLIKDILADINRASMIINNLSRLTLNQQDRLTNVNLLDSINEVLIISKSRLHRSKIRCEINCPPDHGIRINKGEWQQVLINLLNNAIEALETHPRDDRKISINVIRKDAHHEISIEDNGPGIEDDQTLKIFELMVSHKDSGTGIGLWLTKNILARFDSKITVKKSSGGGACFVINMPFK